MEAGWIRCCTRVFKYIRHSRSSLLFGAVFVLLLLVVSGCSLGNTSANQKDSSSGTQNEQSAVVDQKEHDDEPAQNDDGNPNEPTQDPAEDKSEPKTTVEPAASPPGTVLMEDLIVDGVALGDLGNAIVPALGEPQEREQEPDPCSSTGNADVYRYPGLTVRVVDGHTSGLLMHGVQWTTARGLKIGDTLERVEELYPGGRSDGVQRIYHVEINGDEYDVFGIELTNDRVTSIWIQAIC